MNDVRQRLTQAAADDGVPLRTDLHDLLERARADKRRYRTRVSVAAAATTAVVLVGGGFAFQALAGADGSSPAPADSRRETATATAAAQVPKARWVRPVKGCHISERFGTKGSYSRGFHTGLDFRCRYGKPIRAVTAGRITDVGYHGSHGNRTVLTLADGTELWFAHQSAFNVAKGDRVKAGDVIGYVGSTGHSVKPHLHLEVHPGGGDAVDPAKVLAEHGVDVDG
jgi:murein DD-endopeptidase MepM/ murein hydrolase activator NlpD